MGIVEEALKRRKMKLVMLFALLGIAFADPTVYFKEEFGDDWEDRWVVSKHRSDLGKFVQSAGKFYGDAEKDKGIQTSQDARFYGLSAKFDKFSNEDKDLVIQFTVKHEQNIDCGGGYVKVFSSDLDQADMHGDSPYNIMFGPDICGPGTKKVHVIFAYKGKNLLVKKDIRCKDDVFTHLYTLIVKPDNTYIVKIDNEKVERGDLEADWDFLAPKKTPDPEAKKPDDWDDEMDGEWEPPMIDNPDYKGEWKPKQIDNPDYKGKWVHPEIDNPEYNAEDAKDIAKFDEVCKIGFDLWQVKSGTIFDNILITDDVDEAKKIGDETWGVTKDAEKKMKDEQDEAEKAKAEAEAKEAEPEEEDEDDDEDLDEIDDEKEEEAHDELQE